MGIVTGMLKLFFGTKSEKDRKEIEPYVEKIKAVYPLIEQLTNDELRARSAARTQLVIGKLLYERINRLDLFYIRLDFLAVLLAFCSEEQFQHTGNYTHNFCCKSVRN